ncbi:CCA tRNA nucleotidyltransferase [Bacteroidota bacterium]
MKKLEELSHALENNRIFKIIGDAADNLCVDTYVIGGYVRDFLLNRVPEQLDIDIVAIGSGIELAQEVAEAVGKNKKAVSVYKNFGTAAFHFDNVNLEFVGARKESYNRNSRKPVVEDGTLEDDQKRRDFTVNALAVRLNKKDYGQLLDPFNGLDDLRKKIIRTPLDPVITFSDDPLRMLRAIRFASQLNFDIEPVTFDAIINNTKRINIVSQERIIQELNKIILSPNPSYGFKLLYHSGLLKVIFPEMVELKGVETVEGKGHKDNFLHTLQVLDNVSVKSSNLWLRWAAIFHDIAKPITKRYDAEVGWTFHGHEEIGARMVPRIFKRLKLPLHDKMLYVQKLVRLHLRPIAMVNDTITDSALRRLLYEAGDDFDDLMTLCRADITSKNPEKIKRYLRNFNKVEQKLKDVEQRDHVRNFQPPISGEEIMKYFKLQPSRNVGIIKSEIKEAILDGKIRNDYDEAFAFMEEVGKKLGLNISKQIGK